MIKKMRLNKYILAGLASAFIWSFIVIAFRQIKAFPSEQILVARILTSFILCWITNLIFFRKAFQTTMKTFLSFDSKKRKKQLLYIFISGLMLAANWLIFIYIVNSINIRSAALVYVTSPITTAILGFTILQEKINRYKTLALVFALVSLSILGMNSYHNLLWILLCAIAYSIFILMQKYVFPSHKLIIYSFYVTLVLPLLLLVEYKSFFAILQHADWHFVFYIVLIAVFFTIIPMVLNLYSISGIEASTAGIIVYANPLCTFIISKMIFKEEMVMIENIAYALILVTIILFNWKEIQKTFGKNNIRLG